MAVRHAQTFHEFHLVFPQTCPMSPALILASSSETRRAMLRAAGLDVEHAAPRLDEATLRMSFDAEGMKPRDQADAIAEQKALKISQKRPETLVIGGDQVLEFEGKVFGKAESPDDLCRQLNLLSGRRHLLHSAAVIVEDGRPVWRHVSEAQLQMHMLTEAEIEAYVSRNWESAKECVGGYRIEAEGIRLFSVISGEYHAILGFPLLQLLSYLRLRQMIRP